MHESRAESSRREGEETARQRIRTSRRALRRDYNGNRSTIQGIHVLTPLRARKLRPSSKPNVTYYHKALTQHVPGMCPIRRHVSTRFCIPNGISTITVLESARRDTILLGCQSLFDDRGLLLRRFDRLTRKLAPRSFCPGRYCWIVDSGFYSGLN